MAFLVKITWKSRLHRDLHEFPFFLLKSWPTNPMDGKSTNISSLSKRPPCRNLGRSYHYCMWKDFRCLSWFSTTEFLRLIWKVEMPGVREPLSIHYLTLSTISLWNTMRKQLWDGMRPGLPHSAVNLCTLKIPWRRTWQPTPVFLPGKSHGQRNLVSYRPQGCKESNMSEATEHAHPHRDSIFKRLSLVIRDNFTILNYWHTF